MCGIIGLFGVEEAVGKVVRGLNTIKDRGRDFYGLAFGKKIIHEKSIRELEKVAKAEKEKKTAGATDCLGHCLHSIVGVVPQPLKSKKSNAAITFSSTTVVKVHWLMKWRGSLGLMIKS